MREDPISLFSIQLTQRRLGKLGLPASGVFVRRHSDHYEVSAETMDALLDRIEKDEIRLLGAANRIAQAELDADQAVLRATAAQIDGYLIDDGE
jgi:hypothetical protein